MAFSIKQLIPVSIKRAIKRVLGLEKPKSASASRPRTAASRSAVKRPASGKPSSGAGAGKKKGTAKRR